MYTLVLRRGEFLVQQGNMAFLVVGALENIGVTILLVLP